MDGRSSAAVLLIASYLRQVQTLIINNRLNRESPNILQSLLLTIRYPSKISKTNKLNSGKAHEQRKIAKRVLSRLKRPMDKISKAYLQKDTDQVACYTLEKYLEKNKDSSDQVLSTMRMSEFLENPKSMVKVQSHNTLQNSHINEFDCNITQKTKFKEAIRDSNEEFLQKLKELDHQDPRNNKQRLKMKVTEMMARAEEIYELLHKDKNISSLKNLSLADQPAEQDDNN